MIRRLFETVGIKFWYIVHALLVHPLWWVVCHAGSENGWACNLVTRWHDRTAKLMINRRAINRRVILSWKELYEQLQPLNGYYFVSAAPIGAQYLAITYNTPTGECICYVHITDIAKFYGRGGKLSVNVAEKNK